ncbi:MAG: cyanophycin synthetase, partial [Pseudomonadota bacterium]
NALAAIAVARHLGVEDAAIATALAGFGGVNRRFTRVAEIESVTIIDDYGHHPVEIAAVLSAARASVAETGGRVIAVHQPHRFSRLSDLFEEFCGCFNDADVVGITAVYAAGEVPLPGIDRDALVAGLRRHGHKKARAVEEEAGLAAFFAKEAQPGDIFVCLGAGTISAWANALPAALARREAG